MKKITLSIEGMTCSACSNGLEKYLNKQDGIAQATVNLVMATATIEYNEKKLCLTQLEEFVKKAGFKSLGEFKEIKKENQTNKEKIKCICFTFLAIFLMYISMGHMVRLPEISFLNPNNYPMNYMLSLLILTIAFLIYGFDILKNGYKNLIHKSPNMDTLVTIGVLSSFLYSLYNMYQVFIGQKMQIMNLYFESAAIVIYFVKLGRYVDGITKNKTKDAIASLVKITPDKATISKNGKENQVTIDEVLKGDIVISKPGEKIAVDGVIVKGETHLDESFITGESKPVSKKKGSKVIAGSINYDGYIEYKAEKIGKESTISEIVQLVMEATGTKANISKLADKVSGVFVPVVLAIAIITLIVYLIAGQSLDIALTTFVTILVVACPCSLGLATPLAMVIAEGECVKYGILVKKNEILENAKKVDTVVFDKTGTLTYGKLKIAKLNNYCNLEDIKILQIVGSIEKKSTHPISRAFTDYLEENKITPLEVLNFNNIPGLGIIAKIDKDEFLVGNAKILEKHNIINNHTNDEELLTKEGNSIVYVVRNKEVISVIGVNDIIRNNSKQIINVLNKNKIETIMLTGDNQQTAKKIADDLKITKVIANVMPQDKARTIRELKSQGKFVLMCGDGINDSPALATANIGVSIKSGTDIAMDSSDVILIKNDISKIIELINISKKTMKNIKQNLFWAFFYNILMIPIAMGILKPLGVNLNPMIASLTMVLSSITVVLNALRLKRKRN